MKKKLIPLILALACAIACALGLAACEGKELNCLKVVNESTGQLKQDLDIGIYSVNQLEQIKTKLSGLQFVFEYYPDNSTENADMSKVKVKHFINNEGYAGLPDQLQANTSYSVYYYYIGHEPTAEFSDAMCVRIGFYVSEN